MIDPPNVEALVATVRETLETRVYGSWTPGGNQQALEALHALAARIEALTEERGEMDARITALYSAVELIQTERDQLRHERSVATDWAAELAGKKREAEARLARYEAALREIIEETNREHPERADLSHVVRVARRALEEQE